jgi:heat-inducible transcriptional repressor
VVISGERNLLAVSDFSSDMGQLRRAFDLFEQKTQLMRLLDVSSRPRACASSSAAKARSCRSRAVGGQRALRGGRPGGGHAGRDRPHPHAYDRMIQIVDITSRLVSNA